MEGEHVIQNIDVMMQERWMRIMRQREEILEAFVAKYGESPEKYEQVIQIKGNEFVWYVRLRQ